MKNKSIWALLLVLVIGSTAVYGQGMSEFGATHAMSAGLGAGLAASLANNNKVIGRSYKSAIRAQQLMTAQTKAIGQYSKYGCQLELQKKWADAERSFRYVLEMIARRDGPGSVKSVPTLQHLVTVTKAQNKMDDAINFQDTVLSYKQAMNPPQPTEVVHAQQNLVNLLEQNNDYNHAVSVLRQSVSYYDCHPSLPHEDKTAAKISYAKALRKLHRDDEAEAVEAEIQAEQKAENAEQPANTHQSDASRLLSPTPTKASGVEDQKLPPPTQLVPAPAEPTKKSE